MAVLPPLSSPAEAWRDLKAFIAQQGRAKYIIGLISILMPALIVTAFYFDANIKPVQQIIYVESWPDSRSDEEIKAKQKIDEAKRQAMFRERAAKYQKVADELGIDTSPRK